MAGDIEQGERSGLSRRQMIKASAVAGAAAWTAPVIIDSLASPAAAGSGLAFGLSFAIVIFDYNGNRYAMKVDGGTNTCTGTLNVGGDATNVSFGTCNGTTTGIDGSKDLTTSGTTAVAYPGPPACSTLFDFNGFNITSKNGATIVFAFAHSGSFGSGCNNTPGGSAVDKDSAKCPAPGATSVTFTCP